MTQKENLLRQVYELKNEIAILRGNVPVDIEATMRDYRFAAEARDNKVCELQYRIERLTAELEREKENKEKADRAAAYFATEEGKQSKADALAKLEARRQDIEIHTDVAFDTINRAVKGLLGDHWSLLSLGVPTISIGIVDDKGERIFGQSVEIRYEENSWPDDKEEFSINFGTCGSFGVMDGETAGSFARFHIDLGRLLSAETFLDWLKCAMRCHADGLKKLYKEVDDLNAWIKNPVAE